MCPPRQAPAAFSALPTAQESAAPVPAGNGGTLLSWPFTPWQPHQAPGARGPCLVTQQHRLWQSPCLLRVGLRRVSRWRVVSSHRGDDAHLSGKRPVLPPGDWDVQAFGQPKDVCSYVNPVLYRFPTPQGGRPEDASSVLWRPRPKALGGAASGAQPGTEPFHAIALVSSAE